MAHTNIEIESGTHLSKFRRKTKQDAPLDTRPTSVSLTLLQAACTIFEDNLFGDIITDCCHLRCDYWTSVGYHTDYHATYQPLNYEFFVVALGAYFEALAEKEVKGKVSNTSVTLLIILHHFKLIGIVYCSIIHCNSFLIVCNRRLNKANIL